MDTSISICFCICSLRNKVGWVIPLSPNSRKSSKSRKPAENDMKMYIIILTRAFYSAQKMKYFGLIKLKLKISNFVIDSVLWGLIPPR